MLRKRYGYSTTCRINQCVFSTDLNKVLRSDKDDPYWHFSIK
jgi:hypothetical protein